MVSRLQGAIHPFIEAEVRPQFLIGRYELAVFAAMKAVEYGSVSSAASATTRSA
jgi:hypothetical protein